MQPWKIVKHDETIPECEQATFAQLTQRAIDVNGREAECVGEEILVKRAGIAGLGFEPRQLQPQAQFEKEMRGARKGVAPTDTDEVLDPHRLVTRGGPEHRRAQ